MNTKFSKAFFVSGNDFKLTPSITLYHPTVGDVLSIDKSSSPDDAYWTYVRLLLADPYSNMVMLDDMGKNYMEVSPYEVFVLQWDNCSMSYRENKSVYDVLGVNPTDNISDALSFFMKDHHRFIKDIDENGNVSFYDRDNPSCQIDKEVFKYLYEWVKSINHIDDSGRINPADENARRVLIEDMRDEMKKRKRRKKQDDDNSDFLGNIMSAACFCGNGSITPFNISHCKIYWLNESLSINNRKTYAEHVLDGIYHGTISSKTINKKELNWIV
ncbi:MAG: hypothetical protein NC094_10265 [Bacteroidales bacterium]|nr:hypothetical protein [Lachnoclostridium sp.]MCM1384860.1 hypothetical protein [Lachnoclostridium sp.]MCM1465791.1 hypothetical protein [Bacteroidales bacterium]